MIDDATKQVLFRNWGPKAEALECKAMLRFILPSMPWWACYVYAMNEVDGDGIMCLVTNRQGFVQSYEWSYFEMMLSHDEEGNTPELDTEYRPRKASEIFRKLRGGL